MSHFDQMLENTLEKVLSTDLNNLSRAMQFDLQNLFKGLLLDQNTGSAKSGFIDGFDLVQSTPANMIVTLKAGRGFQVEGTAGSYVSDYRFFRLDADYPITIAAAHATLPRIDLIQIKHATQQREQQSRDVFNEVTNQFGDSNIYKREVPYIDTVAIYKQGSPAAQPLFPTLDTGYIAAWYVLVPAAAITIADQNMIDARHWLTFRNSNKDAQILNGLNLRYVDANNIQLTRGMAEILGRRLGISDFNDLISIPLSSNLESGASEQANTWYFWYLVRPQKLQKTLYQGFQSVQEEKKFLVKASSIAPENDGHPNFQITIDIATVGGITLTEIVSRERCLLLGSVFNDASSNIRPFYQEGAEIYLAKRESVMALTTIDTDKDIDFTKICPPGSRFALIEGEIRNTSDVNAGSLEIWNTGFTEARWSQTAGQSPAVTKISTSISRGWILLDSNRLGKIRASAGQPQLAVGAYGYLQNGR